MKARSIYDERLEWCRRIIAGFGCNGEVALRFLGHLTCLRLSIARLSKVEDHLPVLLRVIDLDLGVRLGVMSSAL